MKEGLVRALDAFHNPGWFSQLSPLPALLEERILALEQLGLTDTEGVAGEPSQVRLFAMASLLHEKPRYFITTDTELLAYREVLETQYGMLIFSLPEAIMLFRESNDPLN